MLKFLIQKFDAETFLFLQAARQLRRFQAVIYNTYIREKSPLQVNISRKMVIDALGDLQNPSDAVARIAAVGVCVRTGELQAHDKSAEKVNVKKMQIVFTGHGTREIFTLFSNIS